MIWYYKLLAHRPLMILSFIGIICVACIIVSLTAKQLPDFSNPTLGFEGRGTVLGERIVAWHNLLDETGHLGGKLNANPYEYLEEADESRYSTGTRKNRPRKPNQRHRPQGKKKGKSNANQSRVPAKDRLDYQEKFHILIEGNERARKAFLASRESIITTTTTTTTTSTTTTSTSSTPTSSSVTEDSDSEYVYGRNVTLIDDGEIANRTQQDKELWDSLSLATPPPYHPHLQKFVPWTFCESPSDGYSHFVMERINHNLSSSLFELNGLLAMCDLEQRIILATDQYSEFCVRDSMTNQCCPPWSIPNYVALLNDRQHCYDLTAEDVSKVEALLKRCSPYYHNQTLGADCIRERYRCRSVPEECSKFNSVYNIFHFLADNQFMAVNETSLFLRQAVVFIPLAKSTKILPFYQQLPKSLRNDLIDVPAMDLGLKHALFDELLIADGWLVLLSGLFVVLCMCFYTSSVFITLMTVVAIVFSLGVSYFIYMFVFRLVFFPFMNVLSVVVIIGIGADDAFIFIKMWQCAVVEKGGPSHSHNPTTGTSSCSSRKHQNGGNRNYEAKTTVVQTSSPAPPTTFCGQFWRRFMRSERRTIMRGSRTMINRNHHHHHHSHSHPRRSNSHSSLSSDAAEGCCSESLDTLSGLMASTVRSAGLSMFVTSLTTAAAFYASVLSSITAVRCFGIFSGTAVLVNYVLMMTWLPAAVSLAVRLHCPLCCSQVFKQRLAKSYRAMHDFGTRCEAVIIRLIMCVPWLWVTLFALLAILSGVVVFYWPGLRLPESPDFKLFTSRHPFEVYESRYKRKFDFERSAMMSEAFQLPLRFVWGVDPVDQGDYLNPTSRGSLQLNGTFNTSLPESQEYLLNFCRDLRRQPFYEPSAFGGGLTSNCFIEKFYEFMGRRCFDQMANKDYWPCCENATKPFAPHIFDECLPYSVSSLHATPRDLFMPGVAGPKFRQVYQDNNNNTSSSSSSSGTNRSKGRKGGGNQGKHQSTSQNSNNNELPGFIVRDAPMDPRDGGPPLVAAVVIEFDSTQSSSMSYTEIRAFVETVERWFTEYQKKAPVGMRNAFFVSELEFFDLQHTLSEGTWTAIGMSMGLALVVLFLVTCNLLVSVFAIVTVSATILTTVAVLVLCGWELNVLESVAVSTAIGLAVDFSLHYGVHFQMAAEKTRQAAAKYALSRMIGPTAMAAVTTAAAGIFMLPSEVLAYIQIGMFLVVVMTTSWFYSTFFLMSVLYVMGPERGFGQLQCSVYRWCWGRAAAGSSRGRLGRRRRGDLLDGDQRNGNGSLLGASGGRCGGGAGGGGGGGVGGCEESIGGCGGSNGGVIMTDLSSHKGTENSGISNNPVSDHLLSSLASASLTAVDHPGGSEGGHELDSLTSNSVVKAPSEVEFSRPIDFDRAFKKRGNSEESATSPTFVLRGEEELMA